MESEGKDNTTIKCLTPHCGRSTSGSRGLCSRCYQVARTMVKRGEITWEELTSLGLCRKQVWRRKNISIFKQAIEDLRKGKKEG